MVEFEAACPAIGRAQPGNRLRRIRGALGKRPPDDAGRQIREISLGEAMVLGQQLASFGHRPVEWIEFCREMAIAPDRFREPGSPRGLEDINCRLDRRRYSGCRWCTPRRIGDRRRIEIREERLRFGID